MEKIFIKLNIPLLLPSFRRIIYTLLIILMVSFSILAQTTPASRQIARPKGSTGAYYGYYEYLPANYNTESKLPVVLFFHGIGEKGNGTTDLSKVLRNGPPRMVQNGKDLPFILISPQHNDGWWNTAGVNMMLSHIKKTYKADLDRIYVTGLSAGGYGTWVAGQGSADQLAAIVPICGCGNKGLAANMKNLAVWAFHNDGDPIVQPNCSPTMVNAINAAGGNAKLTMYSNAKYHDAWAATYNDQKMWDWLLAQRRYGSAKPIPNISPVSNAGADVALTLPANSVTLRGIGTDSDGTISSYSWSKQSGPAATLTNANTATLSLSTLLEGTYIFKLTVKDNLGATAYDNVTVKVNPVQEINTAPVVKAGSDLTITLPTNSVSIQATATDVDGTISTYKWTKQSGPAATLKTTNTATLTATGLVEGTYVFRLTATDNQGATNFDETSVKVNLAPITNSAPLLTSIGNKSMDGGSSTTLELTATDSDQETLMFTVNGLPSFASFKDNNNGTASLTFSPETTVSGIFAITVSVTDGDGFVDSETFSLTVVPNLAGKSPETIIYRVNAGGEEIKATPINWEQDKLRMPSKYLLASTYYTEGGCWWPNKTNSTGVPNCVFGSFRTSSDKKGIKYGFPVETGKYTVNLLFAQKDNSFWAGPQKAGDHLFDVLIENTLVFDNLDLFVENGYNGIKKSITVMVTDGILNLDLIDVKGYPQINGIEIVSLGGNTSITSRVSSRSPENVMDLGTVLLYPNPLTEGHLITLEFENPVSGNMSYTLIDQIGNAYSPINEYLDRPTIKHTIDLSKISLSSGIYFLRIKNENKKEKVMKIIKR